ncbi:MAG: hypothetical protein WCJ85_07560 [Chitinophagaceae bacterium]
MNKFRQYFFIFLAGISLAVMLYQILAALHIFEHGPDWQHYLFIGIAAICFVGFLKRPKWFNWFFGLLTIVQCYVHAQHLLEAYTMKQVNWWDAFILLCFPLIILLLLMDRKLKGQCPASL